MNAATVRAEQQKAKQADRARIATALPSAREIYAVRPTHTEIRTDKHGRKSIVHVTDPWPRGYTVADVLAGVNQAGLR